MTGAIRETSCPTVVLGAGAAGLAAAVDLATAGEDVLVLEARERIGGRILAEPHVVPGAAAAELGAEFIHGTSPPIFEWLQRSGDVAVDAARERWMCGPRGLRRAEPSFARLQQRLGRVSPPRADESLDDWLERHRKALSPTVRRLARMLAEGFDAADTSRLSAAEVLEEWRGGASTEAPTFRPSRGFGALVDAMQHALPPTRAAVWLGTVVHAVRWRPGHVEIEALRRGEPVRVRAARVVVTLPLGVLELPPGTSGSVGFDPPLRRKQRAVGGLAMGPVVKLVLRFAHPFWEGLDDGRYRDAAFFFAPGTPFPTFWTSLPVRSPVLVAWCGGPGVARLAGHTREELLQLAWAGLRAVFGRRNYGAMLEGCAWHDWQADPCARGAYSYVVAGGTDARKALASPMHGTLYFAGEACDTGDEAGTVGGALASGCRAAKQILAAAGRRSR